MSSPNAVESLLVRLNIAEYYPAFREKSIDRIIHLRHLTAENLQEMIPDEAARKTLSDAINRNADASAATGAAQARYNDDSEARGNKRGNRNDGENRRPRPKRTCRDFFDNGCGYGEECRFSHDVDQHRAEGAAQSNAPLNKEMYKEEVSVPWESVKLLLGNKADKINAINHRCGTTNSRIEKPTSFHQTYSFDLRGTQEGVRKAKAEIEHFVGITSAKNREARFQYANNELERNEAAVSYLTAANLKNRGTASELSDAVLRRVASTFRFQHAPKLTQFWALSNNGTDKDKFETLIPLIKHFKGIQCIIFAEANRVVEMAKRSKQTAEALGVKEPQFVHRNLSKEDRMKALEAFKKGEVNEHGVTQRVLVTNNDYAKFARKVLIPYVNLVIHFSIPKTKELYLHQAMCTGRNGHEGVSLLFITHHDAATQKEWSAALPLKEVSVREWEGAARNVAYDYEQNSLTHPNADPEPNWRENDAKAQEEKARLKAAKKAAAEAAAAATA